MATCNLKGILDKEGIGQSELANKSGVSSASVYRYAGGKRTPSPKTANKLLKALNAFDGISRKYDIKDIFPSLK